MRKQDRLNAAIREKLTTEFEEKAIKAYSQIVTRYPAMTRFEDAKKRLTALKAPVPTPTAEAIAANKAEQQSRQEDRMSQRLLGNFKKHPSVARASKVGEPNMAEEEVTSAAAMVQDLNSRLLGITPVAQSSQKIGIDAVSGGTGVPPANQPAPGSSSAEGAPPAAAPAQVNELQKPADPNAPAAAQNGKQNQTDDKQDSSSKKKGKKGLRKLIPF
jgi:hypothetical protein